MARARSGGGLAVALVLFTIAFVFALIAAIVFASQKSAAAAQRDEAESKLRAVATANELASVQKPGDVPGTLVGYLAQENQLLKSMVSSQPEVSAASLDARRKELGIEQALFDAVQRLNNELAAANSRAQQAEQAAAAAAERAAAVEASKNELAQQYDATATELRSQIEAVQQGVADWKKGIEGSDAALAEQMAQLRREKDQRIAELEQQGRQKDAEVARLQNELDRRTGVDRATGENIVPSDGVISAIADNGQVVYLNRGSADHLLLGMTFEVFAENELVKTDEFDPAQLRGKATVEVVNIEPHAAQARVVRRGHRAILRAGDKIINLVYDPDKTYRFHIYGNFDLNGDGRSTEAERTTVESMVRSWGGIVSESLSYEVDYLVLGDEPPLPETLPPDVIDPVLIQRNVEQQRVYEQYQSLKTEATSLRIPVLNQNRFLSLVGYYQR